MSQPAMNRARVTASRALLIALALAPTSLPAADLAVTIASPTARQPVFGPVDVVAEVHSSSPVETVEIFVDGLSRGVLRQPPFRLTVDVGQSNVEHTFRAEARTVFGETAEAVLVTDRIQVDESVDVSLLQLFVVVERRGERVLGLQRDDFTIRERGGGRQRIDTFDGGELPFSAVLMVDSSESMSGARLQTALDGVNAFAAGMREDDETLLMLFSDQILGMTPFTSDSAALTTELRDVVATGSTAVNDHLYFALNRLDTRFGRRVVVLLSDGIDVTSLLPMADVRDRARRSQAVVYWIRLAERGEPLKAPSLTSAWRDADANREGFDHLTATIEESGGRIITIGGVDELDDAFREVIDELREQYVLGFSPTDRRHDGSWRQFEVKVRGGAKVRTRGGFVDQ